MKRNIRILLSISILCMTLTINSFASAEISEMPIERNDSATKISSVMKGRIARKKVAKIKEEEKYVKSKRE